ncbi:penicillin-binding protein 2 [Marinilabiliaceae bacterium ANBcel2]|nr:penicillin-binding protein 2 [Marinilabiliaceae bacterium ANBcel2]
MGSNNRTILIVIAIILVGLIFIGKLFMLQVVDPSYKFSAESNTQRKLTEFAARGLIYDRNKNLVVANQATYDIMIVPREVTPFDSTKFCNLLGIDKKHLDRLFANVEYNIQRRRISTFQPSLFFKQLSAEKHTILQEHLYKFPGFFTRRRTVRKYEYPNAAHILGYVTEVNDAMIERDSYYRAGDYAGISGIENTYEKELRGEKGARYILVDVHGREKGSLRGGRMDSAAIAGKDLTISIDIDLQAYGEKIMQNKTGAIVALEPSSGEILSMVSSPTYDPSLLIGRNRSENFPVLAHDTLSPLLNRATMSSYPPGSTFKVLMALMALEEDVLDPSQRYSCIGAYYAPGVRVSCRPHYNPVNLVSSIANSCNSHFCEIFRNVIDNPKYASPSEGLSKWREYLLSYGLGERPGSDLFNETSGFLPNSYYYDRIYNNVWGSLTVLSLGIGQGEVLTTPLQMANVAATIANRGYYYTPRIIKDIEGVTIPDKFNIRHYSNVDSAHYEPVIEGMEQSILGDFGSTARIAQIPGISVCGKTGTSQNPHGENHSVFIAFAPKEDPEIAIAVFVENAGSGSSVAAPIASLIIEQYLNSEIHYTRRWVEERMLNLNINEKIAESENRVEQE